MQNIIIPNIEQLEKTIEAIKRDGKDKLHVLSDFDKTLTKAIVRGQRAHTIIAQIREGKYLTPDYAPKAHQLFDIYHPIEIDTKIPIKEKKQKMHEWWKKHFDLLIESGMNKDLIERIVKEREIQFREGVSELLDFLNRNNIPLIIMSAAPGDMLIEYLKNKKMLYQNIHIIANLFVWNKNGKATGIKEPIIHSLNKQEIEVKSLPIYRELLKRKNVILLGDNMEDISMISGFPYKNLIKIGFLNENIEENFEEYKKNFDVIITNDLDMNYVNELLKKIIG